MFLRLSGSEFQVVRPANRQIDTGVLGIVQFATISRAEVPATMNASHRLAE